MDRICFGPILYTLKLLWADFVTDRFCFWAEMSNYRLRVTFGAYISIAAQLIDQRHSDV